MKNVTVLEKQPQCTELLNNFANTIIAATRIVLPGGKENFFIITPSVIKSICSFCKIEAENQQCNFFLL